jgi:hypothetical protein
MLDAFKQFFTNETARQVAWETTKAGVSYGVDTASEYMPGTRALLTAAAVVVGGVALGLGGRELHRRGHLARVTPDANTFSRERWSKRTAPHQDSSTTKLKDTTPLSGQASTSSAVQNQDEDEPARHTRSHDRKESEHVEGERSRSRSPSPTRRSTNDQ